jgi:hypothetical protein
MASSAFAAGKYAFGFCDRCSFRYPLHELVAEVTNQKRTGLKVCPECLDPDHPQLQLGRYGFSDPQALRNPRPDQSEAASRALTGWNPVGHTSVKVAGQVGTVTISIT